MPNSPEDLFFSQSQKNYHSDVKKDNYAIHILLFVLTFITTTIAGAEWIRGYGRQYEFSELLIGLPYSISILLVLGFHEFGHYFASKIHKVKATLPYFIPFPSIEGFLNFGTLGAVIKTRTPILTKNALFDIGIAGPISGFLVSVALIIYGFLNLPGVEYILAIHPDYFEPTYGAGSLHLEFGDTLLFIILREIFTTSSDFVPPMSEIYHYPYLCIGWFGLFVTAMNLIPVGQLDGGHIAYALFGEYNQFKIAAISMVVLIVLGLAGIISTFLEINLGFGWSGWLFWAFILYFFIKVKHPPIPDNSVLDKRRVIVGYIGIIVFLLSFPPSPFIISLSI